MSKEVTIWIVIGVYALFMLGIGVWYSRKGTDMAGFTVGGRNAGAWISALSYGTAYFSAVMFIGYSGGSGWSYGLWSVLVGVGNAVFGTLLAWLVLANRTRDITRRHDIKSMPQLFEKRFQSRGMRLFACVVIFVFLIPYSASVYKGLTSVCSVILGIDETVCMLIIAIASAVVLVLGGVGMLAAEGAWGRARTGAPAGPWIALTPKQALCIGAFQCLSVVPGMSRSAATILGGWAAGLGTPASTEISFFLAIPVMVGMSGLKLLQIGGFGGMTATELVGLAIGFAVSFLVALVVVRKFVAFLQRRGLAAFGIYRILFGGLTLLLVSLGAVPG